MEALVVLRNAILSLRSIPNVRVPEIKWSGRNMNPQTFLKTNPSQLLNELAYSKGMIKLDAIAWIDSAARFAEFSCVYEFVLNGLSLNPQKNVTHLTPGVGRIGPAVVYPCCLAAHAHDLPLVGRPFE